VSETLYRADTHVHIVEFIFIAEITAAIHTVVRLFIVRKNRCPLVPFERAAEKDPENQRSNPSRHIKEIEYRQS